MTKEMRVCLVEKEALNADNVKLTFDCPSIASTAMPGQFIMLSCGYTLKRPFGVCSVDKSKGIFSIGVKIVGKGSLALKQASPGDMFDVIGPLGNGFSYNGVKKLLVVGGGTGLYPLYFSLQYAAELSIPAIAINGFRSAEDVCMTKDFSSACQQYILSTDCGQLGIKGTAIDALDKLSEEQIDGATVFAVGPNIMMKRAYLWASVHHLFCQVSLERRMACGIGACLVCTCQIQPKELDGKTVYRRCCKDGPVFDAAEVVWEI